MRESLPSYRTTHLYWKQYQSFFPEEVRLDENTCPEEEWWESHGIYLHIDRLPVADSPIKILFIHGAGGNGRLLAPYARMLQQHGYEVISPDLPPYGLSYALHGTRMNYELWITLLDTLMEREYKKDGKPFVVLGSSIGGMLAYHASGRNKLVKGLIATTFVDTSDPDVRDQLAPNRLVSRVGKRIMDLFPVVLDAVRISVKRVSRMDLITNNKDLTRLIMNDPKAAATPVPLELLRTFLNKTPEVSPEQFNQCPVLLVHPEMDPMTPLAFSQAFYDRLTVDKELVILEGAGHFPIEQPGLRQLQEAVLRFLQKIK
ncbi:alpha-beta hydrolase superfamily lysophospholipase [Paenibacillus sp. JGP012]|uniref:alpha/beta hydrolase n=1 Tax=Paenibacillus sp. JGP012 TaxID=2735914 RepID=UPI0016153DA1|nr:alpha/beta hydrolase [Paenibacillus sp. JGP012]MBB6024330.1 alpha-beta hydrolase superfamily lysophospholipase [Paenibacillus sp. JGP012]